MPKIYLGDSVYAEVELGMVALTTDNGLGTTNTIYLDKEVWEALCRFVKNNTGWETGK